MILIEEELNTISRKIGAMLNAKRIDFIEFEMFEDMRMSHKALAERNRLLVLENDELNAENYILKEGESP